MEEMEYEGKDNKIHFTVRLSKEAIKYIGIVAEKDHLSKSHAMENLIFLGYGQYDSDPDLQSMTKNNYEIDRFCLFFDTFLSNFAQNASKIREKLIKFDDFLMSHPKDVSKDTSLIILKKLNELMQYLYENDRACFILIEPYYLKIRKNKVIKYHLGKSEEVICSK